MSYKCPKCSNSFIEKTKFCKICGCNLELIENPTCPKCSAVYNSDMRFCINDGIKLVHPDFLIPKCVICKKTYTNGAKFCPNDGGVIKLNDEILRQINRAQPKAETPDNSFQENINVPIPQPIYNLPKTYNKAPLGKRFVAYLLDGLITSALFLPSLFFLFDFFVGIFSGYGGYNYNYSSGSLFWGMLLFILPLRYSLIKDGLGDGQSYGKRAVDLMVININTNSPCTKLNSAGRNILSNLVSLIPYIGYFIEVIMAIANSEGRKLGDLGAGTQVIEVTDFKSN